MARDDLALNPRVKLWSRDPGRYYVQLVTKRGERAWMGEDAFPARWKQLMDFVLDDVPLLFSSKEAAEDEIREVVLPYIVRWQPGYLEDYVRGWGTADVKVKPNKKRGSRRRGSKKRGSRR